MKKVKIIVIVRNLLERKEHQKINLLASSLSEAYDNVEVDWIKGEIRCG